MSHWNVIVLVGVNVVLLGACLVEWTRRPPARVPAVIVPLPVPPVVEDAASGARGALGTDAVIIALRPRVCAGVALSMARHPSSWTAAPAEGHVVVKGLSPVHEPSGHRARPVSRRRWAASRRPRSQRTEHPSRCR